MGNTLSSVRLLKVPQEVFVLHQDEWAGSAKDHEDCRYWEVNHGPKEQIIWEEEQGNDLDYIREKRADSTPKHNQAHVFTR